MLKFKMIDSSDKIELGQTKWRTKMRRRLKLSTKILIQRLNKLKLNQINQSSFREVCQLKNIHKSAR